jgi:hypothetical protein
MTHFLDTNCFRLVESYYPSRFPSFWRAFDEAVEEGLIASVSEVRKELAQGNTAPHIDEWMKANPGFFRTPGRAELDALRKIFIVPHFQGLVGHRQLITGAPVADPFLVAAAMATGGCVVTEERHKPNSTKIPVVCEHFGIRCTNLEGMLIVLDWSF